MRSERELDGRIFFGSSIDGKYRKKGYGRIYSYTELKQQHIAKLQTSPWKRRNDKKIHPVTSYCIESSRSRCSQRTTGTNKNQRPKDQRHDTSTDDYRWAIAGVDETGR